MASATLAWNEPPPESWRGGAVTIGNFDGVHLGHASLLAALRQQAHAVGGPAVAVTFDPHPLQLLRPQSRRQHRYPEIPLPASRTRPRGRAAPGEKWGPRFE